MGNFNDIDDNLRVIVNPNLFGERYPLGIDHNGVAVSPSAVASEIDNLGPWLVTIDQVHHQQHEGEAFHYSEVITLGSAAVQDYLLTVPAGKYPHLIYSVDGIYGVTIELYEATGKTQSAAAVSVYNRNRNSAKVPSMTVKKGTDGGSGDGTRILWKRSGSGTSGGKLAASVAERSERVLKAATAYIFRLTSAASSNDISIELDWYEEGAVAPTP